MDIGMQQQTIAAHSMAWTIPGRQPRTRSPSALDAGAAGPASWPGARGLSTNAMADITTNAVAAKTRKLVRQLVAALIRSTIGGQIVPPRLWPLATMPSAIPRLRSNQRV